MLRLAGHFLIQSWQIHCQFHPFHRHASGNPHPQPQPKPTLALRSRGGKKKMEIVSLENNTWTEQRVLNFAVHVLSPSPRFPLWNICFRHACLLIYFSSQNARLCHDQSPAIESRRGLLIFLALRRMWRRNPIVAECGPESSAVNACFQTRWKLFIFLQMLRLSPRIFFLYFVTMRIWKKIRNLDF